MIENGLRRGFAQLRAEHSASAGRVGQTKRAGCPYAVLPPAQHPSDAGVPACGLGETAKLTSTDRMAKYDFPTFMI